MTDIEFRSVSGNSGPLTAINLDYDISGEDLKNVTPVVLPNANDSKIEHEVKYGTVTVTVNMTNTFLKN